MIKLQVITADSQTLIKKGKEVFTVVLFCRDMEGNRKILRKEVKPYFLMKEKDYELLKDDSFFKQLEVVSCKQTVTTTLHYEHIVKVYVNQPLRIDDTFKGLNKMSKMTEKYPQYQGRFFQHFESDLARPDNLAQKFLIDNGIKSGIVVDDNLEVVGTFDSDVPLNKWYLDFEAKGYTLGGNPVNNSDPLCMVSIYDTYSKTMYTYYVINSEWNEQVKFTEYTKFPHVICAYENEAKFLDAIVELSKQLKPDMVLAWYGKGYDYPKWQRRVDANFKLCKYKFRNLSPINSAIGNNRSIELKGVVLWDIKELYKKFTDAEFTSYALEYVAKTEELGFKDIPEMCSGEDIIFSKIPFQGSSGESWDKVPDVVFQRNVVDVLIMYALDCKYDITGIFINRQHTFGVLLSDATISNRVIDVDILHDCRNKVALRGIYDNVEDNLEYNRKLLGAVVKEPMLGEFNNVIQLDLTAEYPSFIEGLNISPDTYREVPQGKTSKESYYRDEGYLSQHYYIEYEHEDKVYNFSFFKGKVGIVPKAVTRFKQLRKQYKGNLDLAIRNNEPMYIKKKWERAQYNVKKMTNTIYGTMKYQGFRLHNLMCTQAIAILGRITNECIQEAVPKLDVGYGTGYQVLYMDTDSVFIQLKSTSKEDQYSEGVQLKNLLNEKLNNYFKQRFNVAIPTELEFKAIYDWIMFMGKKNYASHMIWEEKKKWITEWEEGFDVKGVKSVRSDANSIERSSINALFRGIALKYPTSVLQAIVDEALKIFDKGNFDLLDIAYPCQVKGTVKKNKKGKWIVVGYKGALPAHIRAVLVSNTFLNTSYQYGDKPRRLPIVPLKLKTKEGQQTLFKTVGFPSMFHYEGKLLNKKNGKRESGHEFIVKDIAISEGVVIPEHLVKRIDVDRIRKRLLKNLNEILDLHNKKE